MLRVAAIAWCLAIPGLKVALFRRTYGDLWENHMNSPSAFPGMLASLCASKHCRIAGNSILFYNGSRIDLHHCQHEKDRFSYQGAEFHVLMVDELTHFTEVIYRYLRSRVRMTGVNVPEKYRGLFPRILCSGNPGGIGHGWVKRTFVQDGDGPPRQQIEDEGGLLRQYIPSRLQDNPSLNYAEYSAKLAGLGDPLLVRAMLDGDWSIAADSMFGETWREQLHTCDPFEIPIDWQIWRGADDGFTAPAAVHWLTQDPRTKTTYVIDEIYRPKMLPDDMARRIKQHDFSIPLINHDGDIEPNTTALSGILDSAAFGDTGQQGSIPRGHMLNKLGCKFLPSEKWQGSRIARVRYMHHMLGKNPHCPRGLPRLRFFRKACPMAIETIPTLPRDPKNPEDVDTDAEDHAYDSVCYGLQFKTNRIKMAKISGT